jgi:chromate transporter
MTTTGTDVVVFPTASRATGATPRLIDVAVQFAVIGSFTFGGSLSIIALIQDQVVHTLAWLTPQEFIDGLALGQLTPGPPVMLAAYIGYKTLGLTGAVVAAIAIFLPSFVMMLALLPVFERVRAITWARAALQGMVAGVIGTLGVALARLAPHAVVDPFAAVLFVGAVTVLMVWRVAPLRMVAGGAVLGIVRRRFVATWGV